MLDKAEKISFDDEDLFTVTIIPFKSLISKSQRNLLLFHDLGEEFSGNVFFVVDVSDSDIGKQQVSYSNQKTQFSFEIENSKVINFHKYKNSSPNARIINGFDVCTFSGCVEYNLDYLAKHWYAGLPCLAFGPACAALIVARCTTYVTLHCNHQ